MAAYGAKKGSGGVVLGKFDGRDVCVRRASETEFFTALKNNKKKILLAIYIKKSYLYSLKIYIPIS